MSKRVQRKRAAEQGKPVSRQMVLGGVRAAIGKAQSGRGGVKGVNYGINRYRETLKVQQIKQAVAELASHPAYKKVIWPAPFPRDWHAFANRGFDTYLGFPEEVEWCSRSLSVYAEQINTIIQYKGDFDTAFLRGDYRTAKKLLTQIEEEFGLSIWLAEARFSLFQTQSRTQDYRDYLKSITNSNDVPAIV